MKNDFEEGLTRIEKIPSDEGRGECYGVTRGRRGRQTRGREREVMEFTSIGISLRRF